MDILHQSLVIWPSLNLKLNYDTQIAVINIVYERLITLNIYSQQAWVHKLLFIHCEGEFAPNLKRTGTSRMGASELQIREGQTGTLCE